VSTSVSIHLPRAPCYASRLQQLLNGVIYVQQCKATSSSRTPGQSDMDKEALFIPAGSLELAVRDPSLPLTQFCLQLKSVIFCRSQWYIFIGPAWQSRL